MDIVEVTGAELSELLRMLRSATWADDAGIHILRVAIDDGSVKFKINEGIWTPGYGTALASTDGGTVAVDGWLVERYRTARERADAAWAASDRDGGDGEDPNALADAADDLAVRLANAAARL